VSLANIHYVDYGFIHIAQSHLSLYNSEGHSFQEKGLLIPNADQVMIRVINSGRCCWGTFRISAIFFVK
jgi:hypothetical protein